jgi:ribonuclease HI
MTVLDAVREHGWVAIPLAVVLCGLVYLAFRVRRMEKFRSEMEELAWRVEQLERRPLGLGNPTWGGGDGHPPRRVPETGTAEDTGASPEWVDGDEEDPRPTSGAVAEDAQPQSRPAPMAYAWVHGEASGDPGPAAIGVIIRNEHGELRSTVAAPMGQSFTALAEFQALITALTEAQRLEMKSIVVHTDSESLLDRLKKGIPSRGDGLVPLLRLARKLVRTHIRKFDGFDLVVIPEERNREAIRLTRDTLSQQPPLTPSSPPHSSA